MVQHLMIEYDHRLGVFVGHLTSGGVLAGLYISLAG